MSEARKQFEEAVDRLVDESPKIALEIITGYFVGLITSLLTAHGKDADQEIVINGGASRDITIHAVKGTTDA